MIVYCQDTTINQNYYNKILISFENCGNEVKFYKNELVKCNFSDSLKTVVYDSKINQLNNKLIEKEKQNKKNKFKNFVYGTAVGVVIITIINLIK